MPEWLQYGSFGLLALVLIAWFAQNRKDREFIENLARNAIGAMTSTADKLQGVLADNTKTMALMCEKLNAIPPAIESNGKATREVVEKNGEETRRKIEGLSGPLRRNAK